MSSKIWPLANKYFPGLDGIRAISITFVILTHLGVYDFFIARGSNFEFELVSGWTGVRIFFVLSGFLITLLLLKERQQTGTISLKGFYLRRTLRILPCYLVFLGVILFLMVRGTIEGSWHAWVAAFLYLTNFLPLNLWMGELAHTWSLAVEEHFYLIWPFLFLVVSGRRLFILTVGLIVLSLASENLHPLSAEQAAQFKTSTWTSEAIFPILFGCAFAQIVYQIGHARALLRSPVSGLIGIVLFAAVAWLPHERPLALAAQCFGIGLILSWVVLSPEALITRILDWGPLRFTGRISYGLYVWQGLFLLTGPTGHLWFQRFPVNIALTLAAAVLSYFAIERPILQFRDLFVRSGRLPAPSLATVNVTKG